MGFGNKRGREGIWIPDPPDVKSGCSELTELTFCKNKKDFQILEILNSCGREGIRTPDPLGVNQVL